MKITINTEVNAPCCPCEIVAESGESILVQTDWEYPPFASTFGWCLRDVGPTLEDVAELWEDVAHNLEYEFKIAEHRAMLEWNQSPISIPFDDVDSILAEIKTAILQHNCQHDGTDGTVDCDDCGLTAGDFIESAGEWLEANDGATVADPGYFQGESE